jgi:hypothetical protein
MFNITPSSFIPVDFTDILAAIFPRPTLIIAPALDWHQPQPCKLLRTDLLDLGKLANWAPAPHLTTVAAALYGSVGTLVRPTNPGSKKAA